MNTTVSFETAKLLNKKGLYISSEKRYNRSGTFKYSKSWSVSAPTIADAVMWLYEKHGIWIEVTTDVYGKFCWLVKELKASNNNFNSPTEAYEAAIKYTLNNLI